MRIRLELDRSLEENAAEYFDKAKKARSKQKGAREALEITKRKLARKERVAEHAKQKADLPPVPKKWYHKYRWGMTRNGHLVVGGQNADANETLMKRQAQADDIVFHTDMAGSPFVILRPDSDAPVEDDDMEDAAQFTACYSSGWKAGMASVEVFHVSPDQVTKQAQSGEYLPKGAFMIRGDTEYHHPSLVLAIGTLVREGYRDQVIVGSPDAVKHNCTKYFRLAPGSGKTSDIAKRLQRALGGELDEYVQSIPAGGSRIL